MHAVTSRTENCADCSRGWKQWIACFCARSKMSDGSSVDTSNKLGPTKLDICNLTL
jgi:hypothetical protein